MVFWQAGAYKLPGGKSFNRITYGRKKMFGRIKKEKMTYGIVGLGRFGMALARELASDGCELLVIDRDEEKVREIREFTENAFVTVSLDKKTLAETGIQNCDVAVVCIGEKMDISILATLNLISFGIPRVIAKANSHEHGEVLEKLGAEVVYPERDMAVRLANRLEASRTLDFIQLSESINITKLQIFDSVIGKSVRQTNFRTEFNLNIIAIENDGNVIKTVTPDYIFKKNDILYLSGSKKSLIDFNNWLEENVSHT